MVQNEHFTSRMIDMNIELDGMVDSVVFNVVRWNRPDMLNEIMDRYVVDVKIDDCMLIDISILYGYTKILQTLLTRGSDITEREMRTFMCTGIKHRRIKCLYLLARQNICKDNSILYHILIVAIQNGHTDIVRRLMCEHSYDVNQTNMALSTAIKRRHVDTIELLMACESVDLSIHSIELMEYALFIDDADMIDSLLENDRVEVSHRILCRIEKNIGYYSRQGQGDSVGVGIVWPDDEHDALIHLLKHRKFASTCNHYRVLIAACRCVPRLDVIRFIMRERLCIVNSSCLMVAAEHDNVGAMMEFRGHVDFHYNDNEVIVCAAQHGESRFRIVSFVCVELIP
jgi:hypothetical protein